MFQLIEKSVKGKIIHIYEYYLLHIMLKKRIDDI